MKCGVCDKEMFSATPSSVGVTVCGSCVTAPLPSPESESDYSLEEAADSDHDLSYLDDTKVRKRPKARSLSAVQMDLAKSTLLVTPTTSEVPVKRIKVKSNHLRDRIYPIGELMVRFDGHGIAEIPEAYLETIQRFMRARPGRLKIVSEVEEPKKPATKSLEEARAALSAAKVAVKEEPPPTPEPATEIVKKPAPKATASKKAPKKSSKKNEES